MKFEDFRPEYEPSSYATIRDSDERFERAWLGSDTSISKMGFTDPPGIHLLVYMREST